MIDFASALYLGMHHPAASLGHFAALTTGMPASLAAAPLAGRFAAEAAALEGCEAALVAPSTLHLAIDVFDRLRRTHRLVADEALYPVMRWGLERAIGMGARVEWFRHGDTRDLVRRLERSQGAEPPAIVTDATRRDGTPIRLKRYVEIANRRGGVIVMDHSQILGLLGAHPTRQHPWGHGGGGAVQYAGLDATQPVLLVASWAKAFGAPLATLCGPLDLLRGIAHDGPTQTHSSAVNTAALLAGLQALQINRHDGERLRAHLMALLRRLHAGLRWQMRERCVDLHVSGRLHPLLRIRLRSPQRTRALQAALQASGFRTALLSDEQCRWAMGVVVRADHRNADIDALLCAMGEFAQTPVHIGRVAPGLSSMEERQHV